MLPKYDPAMYLFQHHISPMMRFPNITLKPMEVFIPDRRMLTRVGVQVYQPEESRHVILTHMPFQVFLGQMGKASSNGIRKQHVTQVFSLDSKVHRANMGPPGADRTHVGPMNFAIRVIFHRLGPCQHDVKTYMYTHLGPFLLAYISMDMPSMDFH